MKLEETHTELENEILHLRKEKHEVDSMLKKYENHQILNFHKYSFCLFS
jgi:hypothetical protein